MSRYTYRIRTVEVQVSESFDPDRPIVGDPDPAGEFCADLLQGYDADVEHFLMVAVDATYRASGYKVISSGTRNQTPVDPARVFRLALKMDAVGIIIAHNHPSGQLEPSPDDIELTRRLVGAGELIGIQVFDHIITGINRLRISLRRSRPGLFAAQTA